MIDLDVYLYNLTRESSILMQPARLGALAWCFVSTVLLVLLVLAPSSRAQQAVLETPQQVNDRIRSMSAAARVMPHDYVIGIPLVPVRLHVAGLTEVQAEQKISEILESNGLVSHAEVSLSVKERKSKPITVVGAVGHAMVVQADRPVTLLEVLAEAGGVANDAGDTVIVNRPAQEGPSDPSEPPVIGPADHAPGAVSKGSIHAGSRQEPASSAAAVPNTSANSPDPIEPPLLNNTITINLNELMESGDASNNIILQAGDIVTVPHSGIVYLLGAVTKPGGFILANDRGQMTTLKILALAGGLSSTAKSDHAVIVRKDAQGQQHEVAVDLKKVMERQAEDVQLQPGDILYVPNSAGKRAMLRSLEFGIALGSGVALYRVAYR